MWDTFIRGGGAGCKNTSKNFSASEPADSDRNKIYKFARFYRIYASDREISSEIFIYYINIPV